MALNGICQNPLFASSLLKSVAPANCARVSSTWGMGYVSAAVGVSVGALS